MKRRRCRGVAAIEAALVLFATSALLVNLLYCGRLALDGAALDRAASGAARYLSTVPLEDLHDSARRGAALAAAQAIAAETLAAAGIDVQQLQLEFLCDPGACATLPAGVTPSRVGVLANLSFYDEVFGGHAPTQLTAYAEVGRDN